jgi:hypothetical protein
MLADATATIATLSDQLNLCCTHGSVGRTDVLHLSLAFANWDSRGSGRPRPAARQLLAAVWTKPRLRVRCEPIAALRALALDHARHGLPGLGVGRPRACLLARKSATQDSLSRPPLVHCARWLLDQTASTVPPLPFVSNLPSIVALKRARARSRGLSGSRAGTSTVGRTVRIS